ncbi:MAG: hypothetical protein CXR31_09270 [Geobacter sp.]|nr:MAG: hypothetical protein CXR31_09270 [Geobacter sp.]
MKGLRSLVVRMIPVVAFLVLIVGVVASYAATISGTVTNSSSSTGRVYVVVMDPNNSGNDPVYGVSLDPSVSTAFSIKGVPDGTYNLAAFLDRTGTGVFHANDPANMISNVTVSGDVNTGTITLSDMPPVAPSSTFKDGNHVNLLPGTRGAVLLINHETDPSTGGIVADSYDVACNSSTQGTINRTISVSGMDKKMALLIIGGLDPASTLSCTVTPYVGTTPYSGVAASANTTIVDTCNVFSSCATGATVTGRVDLSAFTPTELAGKTLAVALSDWSDNPPYIWAVTNPSTLQTFSIPGVAANPRAYRTELFLMDSSTNNPGTPFYRLNEKNEEARLLVESSQPVIAPDQKISKRDSYISVNTVAQFNQGNTSPGYGLTFSYGDCGKRAVNIQLANGTNGAVLPTEGVSFTGSGELYINASSKPQGGDDYTATITYADGTSATQPVTVVKGTIDDFLGQSFPVGNVTIPGADLSAPMFGWHYSLPQTMIPYTVSVSSSNGGYGENYTSATNWLKPTMSGPLSVGATTWSWLQLDDVMGDSLRYNGSFTLVSGGPTISSFTPATGATGTVTITGSGFTGATGVTFNGMPAASYTVNSDTQITATIPWGAARGPITVTDGSGTTTASSTPFERTYTLSGKVTNLSGTGLNGIAMRTIGTGTPVTATSSSTGGYSLSSISAGVPHVVNFHDGTNFYLDVYTRFMTNTEDSSGQNYLMLSSADLSNFSAIDSSFGAIGAGTAGMIAGKVMDTSVGTPLSGAVLDVHSKNYAASPTTPYKVIYGNSSGVPDTTLTSTTSSGRFFVTGIEQGDMVVLDAAATGYTFSPSMYQVYKGTVSEGPVLGAQMPTVSLDPPSGSSLASGSPVTVTWSPAVTGTLFYTTDGSDPRNGGNTIGTSGSTITLSSPFATTINLRYVFKSGAGIYGSDGSASYNITGTDPVITDFTPTTVLPGDTVTITGMNFNTTAGNNMVYFGGGASVAASTATATQLTVVVPSNAYSGSIQVTDTGTGKTSQFSTSQLTVLQMMTVSGQFTDATSSNIMSTTASVTATFTVNSITRTSSINMSGTSNNYSLPGVPWNTDFVLKFSAPNYASAYSGTLNNASWYSMALYPTATFNSWNNNDASTGVIRGHVSDQTSPDASGFIIATTPGFTVKYDDGSGNISPTATSTSSNGIFYVTGITDLATVTVTATKAGYLVNPVTVVGHAGSVSSVDMPAAPVISVSGTIVNSDNQPVTGVAVTQLGTSNIAGSSAGGAFTISGLPGGSNFELMMSQTGYVPIYTGPLNFSADTTIPYPFVLFSDLTSLGITPGKGAIIGRVVNSQNPAAAISGMQVTASPYTVVYYDQTYGTGGFNPSATATDDTGMFIVMNVDDQAWVNIFGSNPPSNTIWTTGTSLSAHGNAVSEIMVPCNVPQTLPQWGNLQWPTATTVTTNQATENIFGQVYLPGVTDVGPGPAPGLVAELGYGPTGTDPSIPANGWIWKTAPYNSSYAWSSSSGKYEYVTTLTVPTAGSYDYVYRYSYNGSPYIYGDLTGSSDGYSSADAGKLTVNDPAPTTTTVSASPDPSTYGQQVTFTATVSPSAATGYVGYAIDGTSYAPTALSGGTSTSFPYSLPAGTHTILATYFGDSTYGTSNSTTTITVNKATPTITWNNPADITYNTPLSTTQLNATTTVSGTFAYDPPLNAFLNVGTHTLSVTFTPDDTANYTTATATVSITVNTGPLHHLAVSVINPQTAGVAANFTVTAQDLWNNTITGYTGTVHFTSTDSLAVLPSDYTFVAGDNGTHTFTSGLTLKTAGYQHVTATDTVTSTLTGTTGPITVNPGPATHFNVAAPSPVTAGTAFNVTVTARDAYENTTSFGSGINFTSTDSAASLPPWGVAIGTYSITLYTAGSRTVSVTDFSTGTISGTSGIIAVAAAPAATFDITAPVSSIAGSVFTVTVTAKDAYGNIATGYTGSMFFLSTDSQADLPASYASPYTFIGADNGTHTFTNVTLKTAGSQNVNVHDTINSMLGGVSSNITVSPAAASKLAFTAQPTNAVSLQAITPAVQVAIQDQYGNTVTSSTASVAVALGTNPGSGTLSGTLTKAAASGIATFSDLSLDRAAAGYTLTATSSGLAGATSNTFTVAPGPLNHFGISAVGTQTALTPFSITVTAMDMSSNTVTSFGGTANLSVSGGSTISPLTTGAFTNGVWTGNVTVSVAGTARVITVTSGTPSGTSTAFDVNLASQTTLTVTGMPVTAQPYGATFTVGTSGGSGTGAVSYSANGSCSVDPLSGLVTIISGTGTCSVTATKAADSNYSSATSAAATVAVTKATPVISWGAPAAITYGTALSATQLNATASVPGAFVYTPAGGTVPSAGTQTLSATFTPTDTTNYNNATATVSLTVNQATPTVTTWPTASAITYGQPLASSSLTGGTASVGGSFAFTAPSTGPNAGTANQSVIFTPTDTTNYTTVSGTVSVTVNKATPVITWANPTTIVYGTALDAAQLNAAANPSGGTFAYSPVSGTVPNAGSQTLSVTYTPIDTANYNNATATVSITITQKPLTITGITAANKPYDGATAATLTGTGTLVGVLTADVGNVTLSGTATGAFSDKNVGTGKTVNFSGLTLTGSAAGNYSITGTANTMANITAAPLTVTAAAQTKVYGAVDPALTYTPSGLVGGDTTAVFTGALARTAGETVAGGSYAINQGTLSAGGNYTITFTGANLTITPAPLTVTADNKLRFEKLANPTFTATYTGFVTGETASVLGGTLAITTTATSASAPGSYPITPAGLTSTNYSITFVPGNLTVRIIGDIAGSPTGTSDGTFSIADALKYLRISLGLDPAPATLDGVKLAPVVGGVPTLSTGTGRITVGDVVAALEHLVGLW